MKTHPTSSFAGMQPATSNDSSEPSVVDPHQIAIADEIRREAYEKEQAELVIPETTDTSYHGGGKRSSNDPEDLNQRAEEYDDLGQLGRE